MKHKRNWPWKDKPLHMTPAEMVHELGQDGVFYWLAKTNPRRGGAEYIACAQQGRQKWY